MDGELQAAAPRVGRWRWAVRALVVLAAAGLIALLIYGVVTKSDNTTIDDNLADGKSTPAPHFDLPVLSPGVGDPLGTMAADGSVSAGDLRGRPVVLNFWASWCQPCRVEAPVLERSWRAQRRAGSVLFLGLDMQDITNDARAFLRGERVTYPAIRDEGNAVARRYGVTGLPETFFLSRSGRVVGHVIGAASAAQLRAGIAAARRGLPAGVRQGGARRKTRASSRPGE